MVCKCTESNNNIFVWEVRIRSLLQNSLYSLISFHLHLHFVIFILVLTCLLETIWFNLFKKINIQDQYIQSVRSADPRSVRPISVSQQSVIDIPLNKYWPLFCYYFKHALKYIVVWNTCLYLCVAVCSGLKKISFSVSSKRCYFFVNIIKENLNKGGM